MRCPACALKRSHGRSDCRARGAMPCSRGCVAEKSPLTNRIRRQFARIKAVRTDSYRSWLLSEFWRIRTSHDLPNTAQKSGHFEDESQDISKTKVRTFRRRKSGHFEDESQDISKTKVRTFRRR